MDDFIILTSWFWSVQLKFSRCVVRHKHLKRCCSPCRDKHVISWSMFSQKGRRHEVSVWTRHVWRQTTSIIWSRQVIHDVVTGVKLVFCIDFLCWSWWQFTTRVLQRVIKAMQVPYRKLNRCIEHCQLITISLLGFIAIRNYSEEKLKKKVFTQLST